MKKKRNKNGHPLITIAYLEAEKNEIKHQIAALEQDKAQLSAKILALKKEMQRLQEKANNLRSAAQDCESTGRRLLARRWSQDANLEEQRCSKIKENVIEIEAQKENIERKIIGREYELVKMEKEISKEQRRVKGWLRSIWQKLQIFCKDFFERLRISF